jgi:hypothetical protein
MRPAASGAIAGERPGAPLSPALQWRRAHFCQRTEPPHRVFSTPRGQPGLVSDASSPPGRRPALERAKHRSRPIETVSATAPFEERWPPRSETPSAGWKPCRARADIPRAPSRTRVSTAGAHSPVAFSLRASPVWALSAATKSVRAGPTPPTDLCNRQRAWAHRRGGSHLATEPAVSAHSAAPR